MPIKSNKLGPGTFTIGTGTPTDYAAQVASFTVKWNLDQDDAVPVLSGDELEGDETWTATLSGNVIADLTDGGMVEWTWTNKGTVVPFTFVPSTTAGMAVSGQCKVRPLDIGGDAKKTMRSDFEWSCVGEPSLSADLT